MAPDRGPTSLEDERAGYQHGIEDDAPSHGAGVAREYLADQASQPQNFTLRGVLVGLAIGVVICFSNMYFGLQTGWVSSMAMPSALIGFAYFKVVARTLKFPFTPVENVLVQSVAGSVGTMPLGCGFVGVIPALNYLLKTEENGPLDISLWRLIIWSVGICFFGVVFAVPLRREMIIREKLKFPSGTATALLIKVLHGDEKSPDLTVQTRRDTEGEQTGGEEAQGLLQRSRSPREEHELRPSLDYNIRSQEEELGEEGDWKSKIRLLLISFGGSALYTVISYFIPQLHDIPIFGLPLARTWLWTLNPSPAYVGQGIIMGPSTTLHMLLGSIIGWGILSPLAKHKGWAPGPVSDWTNGSKGWIVWISLAIMLADSLINLGWLILRPVLAIGRAYYPSFKQTFQAHTWKQLVTLDISTPQQYAPLNTTTTSSNPFSALKAHLGETSEPDAPPSHLISNRTTLVGLLLSLILCIAAIHISFPNLIPLRLTLLSLLLALLLSIMGVRALGETDLNPVSGISKLTQLIFALVTPTSGPAAKNAVIINLVAGAVSESAALQAGDLLQDLKCGHLLGAAPKAQFYGQIIGSAVGAVVSAVVYKLYTRVYSIPGGLFEVPTAYVWVFTARLVTGDGLPPMVVEWAGGAAVLFALGTVVRVWGTSRKVRGLSAWWIDFVPGGIAVAVGMYNTPSFTLARTIGGLVSLWWRRWKGRSETPIIVLASGLILGEGLFSIVNLLLASLNIPHL